MRALGNVWNSMSEEGKEEWKNLSDADKARRVRLVVPILFCDAQLRR